MRIPRRIVRKYAFMLIAAVAALVGGQQAVTGDYGTGSTLSGRVVKVTDGDTVTILTPSKKEVKVRLAEIDTPEKRQPWGNRAKQALADLVFDKNVTVKVSTKDRYGRSIGRIYAGELDVNAQMVRTGNAWVYRRYAKDKRLFAMEDSAREAGLGLWGLPETKRMPPWEWRRAH